jgi:hypothetical protein
MNNIMIDIETLGTVPGSIVLSIGAVYFGPEGLGEEFYAVIDRRDSEALGLTFDADTVEWWTKQCDGARAVLLQSLDASVAQPLDEVLGRFSDYVKPNCKIWGNGADFDNVLVAALYRIIGKEVPWRFWNNRCYRTLKAMFPGVKGTKKVTAHDALQDAIDQAEIAVEILKKIEAL